MCVWCMNYCATCAHAHNSHNSGKTQLDVKNINPVLLNVCQTQIKLHSLISLLHKLRLSLTSDHFVFYHLVESDCSTSSTLHATFSLA